VLLEGLGTLKKLIYLIGTQTRNLSACKHSASTIYDIASPFIADHIFINLFKSGNCQ
jgi:hypothetical protein